MTPKTLTQCAGRLLSTACAALLIWLPGIAHASSQNHKAPTASTDGSDHHALSKTPSRTLGETATRELFDALDLSTAQMEGVRKAVQAQDWALAKRELAAYLRTRDTRTWHWRSDQLPQASVRQEIADKAVDGTVMGGLVNIWHTFPDGTIDWSYNATREQGPYNPEWQWQLNRMGFWKEMAGAYRNSRDERYPQAWVRQLHSFLEQCPVPDTVQNQRDSTWRTIEAGLRMSGSWPEAFHSFLHSPSLSAEDLAAYMHGTLQHARYLAKFNTRANWLTMEMNGLYTAGVVFPEFREAEQWRRTVIDTLAAQAKTQFLPDGAHYELTPGYHTVALSNILAPLQLANAVGRADEFPADYTEATENAYDFLLKIMTPDRGGPTLNDSWRVNVRSHLTRALRYFPQRRDFRWITTDGKHGKEPAQTSFNLDWAGYLVMRSGWGQDANYLLFDVGPLGLAHAHQDKLNVIFHPYGRQLLFDGTGGSYEQSPWRQYAIDTFSHNTILMDGLPQRRNKRNRKANVSQKPIDSGWQSTPEYDFGYGVYKEGYGEKAEAIATHTRRVLFVRQPGFAVIADTLEPNDKAGHTYQARWHLLTTQTELDPDSKSVTTVDAGLPNMAIIPLLTEGLQVASASGQTEPELLGWNVIKDKQVKQEPATTVTHTRTGSGRQQFITLLLPLRAGESCAQNAVRAIGNGVYEVTLCDGARYRIEIDEAPTGAIRSTRLVN